MEKQIKLKIFQTITTFFRVRICLHSADSICFTKKAHRERLQITHETLILTHDFVWSQITV